MYRRLQLAFTVLASLSAGNAGAQDAPPSATRVVASYKPDAALEGLAPGPDGSVIVTSNFDRMLLKLDPHNSLTPFASLPAYPQVIVTMPGGFLVTAHAKLPFPDGKLPPPPAPGGPPPRMPPLNHLATTLLLLDGSGFVVGRIPGPDGAFFNGLAMDGNLVLIADSAGGRLWRADLPNRTVSPWLTDPLLSPGDPASLPGANGLKIHGGYAYVSNTARGTIHRVRIGADGAPQGALTLVAHIGFADDFDIAADGTIVIPTEGGIARILPDGSVQHAVAAPCAGCDTAMLRPGGAVLLATHGRGISRLIEARLDRWAPK